MEYPELGRSAYPTRTPASDTLRSAYRYGRVSPDNLVSLRPSSGLGMAVGRLNRGPLDRFGMMLALLAQQAQDDRSLSPLRPRINGAPSMVLKQQTFDGSSSDNWDYRHGQLQPGIHILQTISNPRCLPRICSRK